MRDVALPPDLLGCVTRHALSLCSLQDPRVMFVPWKSLQSTTVATSQWTQGHWFPRSLDLAPGVDTLRDTMTLAVGNVL